MIRRRWRVTCSRHNNKKTQDRVFFGQKKSFFREKELSKYMACANIRVVNVFFMEVGMKLIYQVEDKPKFGALIVFAIQQLLAIMTATLVVPIITNSATGSNMSSAAALFGAGVGTLVYVLFTARKSPVFLGSSFAFLGSMAAAFAGGVSMQLGYLGLIFGAVFAGLVYVVIAIIVKFVGVGWINKLMPAVVIGPTVAIIGLSLAGNAMGDIVKGGSAHPNVALLCGLITIAEIGRAHV